MRVIFFFVLAAGAAFAQAPAPQSPVENAYSLLDMATLNTNPLKRIAAVQAMGIMLPEPRPVGLVERLLSDRDTGNRQSACSTLGEMKARASIPKLHDALNDAAPEVVFAAAKALYEMGDPDGRAVLVAVLAGDRANSSGAVSASVREAKTKLHDPKALLIIGAKEGVSILGFGFTVPIVDRLMKDRESSGKTAAALLLATDTTEESKQAIRTALSDKNWTVRVAAARSVANRGLTDYYDDVVAMLYDKNDDVEYTAASVVIRLKQPPAAPPGPLRPRR